ncbi:sulfotransferase [bacterium]|nr:sulfotransferase [bacterium]
MKGIFEIGAEALDLARLYPVSFYRGWKNRKLFEDVETYCMFIGYPRSGHSLIGALLDAHPNMIMAHELGALKYVHALFSKKQIYSLLLEKSQLFATGGQKRGGYLYDVPNQWQGKYRKLQIIGDKQGAGAILRLRANPWLLKRLKHTFSKIKFIHVIRNPYDNISSISKKQKVQGRGLNLRESINYYFSLCETVTEIKKQIEDDELFELKHESFIDSPTVYLRELCCFLGVDASDDYLNDCANIVFKSPNKSRYNTQWSSELIDIVKDRIDKFLFLHGYSYED